MSTKEEKLKKLEDGIIDELESIDDLELLAKKLEILLLVIQIKRFREGKDV